jgi:hypothetical protein
VKVAIPRLSRVPIVSHSPGRSTGEAEHRDVGAGAERDRDHRDGGEAGIARELAGAMPCVVPEARQPAAARGHRRAGQTNCR